MTVQTKTTLKTYFQTGDKPTQSNFEDLIDTFVTESSAATVITSASNIAVHSIALGGSGAPSAAFNVGFVRASANTISVYASGNVQAIFKEDPDPDFGPTGSAGDQIRTWVEIGGHTAPSASAGTTDGSAIIYANSKDINHVALRLTSKGQFGPVHVVQNGFNQFTVGGGTRTSATAIGLINYLLATGVEQGSGNNPALSAQRASTSQPNNFGVTIYTVGSGSHFFKSENTTVTQLEIASVSGAVNYLAVLPAKTGIAPIITAGGGDANITPGIYGRGTGGVFLGSNTATNQVNVRHTSAAVLQISLTGAVSGSPPSISVSGNQNNIPILIHAIGSADIRLGNDSRQGVVVGVSALSPTAISGFLWIPSHAGSAAGAPVLPYPGAVAVSYNFTANRIEVYSSGAWRGVAVV